MLGFEFLYFAWDGEREKVVERGKCRCEEVSDYRVRF